MVKKGRPRKEETMKSLNITLTQTQYNLLQSKGNKSEYIRNVLNSNGTKEVLCQRLEAEKRNLTGINMSLQQQLTTLKQFFEEGKFKVYTNKMDSKELKFMEEL